MPSVRWLTVVLWYRGFVAVPIRVTVRILSVATDVTLGEVVSCARDAVPRCGAESGAILMSQVIDVLLTLVVAIKRRYATVPANFKLNCCTSQSFISCKQTIV
jgi:hypothetical protein